MEKRMRHWCLWMVVGYGLWLLGACGHAASTGPMHYASPIDSFEVQGIRSGYEVQDFHYLNDSVLFSFNPPEQCITYYYRQPGTTTYQPRERLQLDIEPLSSIFEGDDQDYYFISRSNVLYGYDSCFKKKLLELPFHHSFDYLKDSFLIVSNTNYPVIKRRDTLILPYAYDNIDLYDTYFKEPAIAEFLLRKDSLHFLKNYGHKPERLRDYYFPFSSYCYVNNTLFLLYPCYDTIYTYDRTRGLAGKIALHNKDYQLPGTWDFKEIGRPGYNSYQTRYELNNFSYECIYFDEATRHFIVFYKTPVSHIPDHRLATYKDQKRKAMILNERMEILHYLTFDKNFVMAGSYFFIPGKGLAMPVFKSKTNYETTRFYTYRL